MRKPLSRLQGLMLILFWAILCFVVVSTHTHIDGPLILTIIISGALVIIPIAKGRKGRRK